MNREFVLFHLREAAAELGKAVKELEADPTYGSGELLVVAQHAYHHLNSAWNGQDLAESQTKNMTNSGWNRLGSFPTDFPLMRV